MKRFITNKYLLIGAGIFILVIGIEASRMSGGESQMNLGMSLPLSNTEETATHKTNQDELLRVVRVVDGDTIEVENGERVRYIGMDTPETVDPRKPVQCFGVEASEKNKELVLGKMARLEKDVSNRDKYNRLLRYVWIDDAFINLELVKLGFARSYSYPPDIKYQDQFLAAERYARGVKNGLWGACPPKLKT